MKDSIVNLIKGPGKKEKESYDAAMKKGVPLAGVVGGYGMVPSEDAKRGLGFGSKKDNNFFGHSKVNKQNIVKNPPKQVPQLGKDRFYSDVTNNTGKL